MRATRAPCVIAVGVRRHGRSPAQAHGDGHDHWSTATPTATRRPPGWHGAAARPAAAGQDEGRRRRTTTKRDDQTTTGRAEHHVDRPRVPARWTQAPTLNPTRSGQAARRPAAAERRPRREGGRTSAPGTRRRRPTTARRRGNVSSDGSPSTPMPSPPPAVSAPVWRSAASSTSVRTRDVGPQGHDDRATARCAGEVPRQLRRCPGGPATSTASRPLDSPDFRTAIRRVDRDRQVAEMDHHPDLDIAGARCTSASAPTTRGSVTSSTSTGAPHRQDRRAAGRVMITFFAMSLPALVILLIVAGTIPVALNRRHQRGSDRPRRSRHRGHRRARHGLQRARGTRRSTAGSARGEARRGRRRRTAAQHRRPRRRWPARLVVPPGRRRRRDRRTDVPLRGRSAPPPLSAHLQTACSGGTCFVVLVAAGAGGSSPARRAAPRQIGKGSTMDDTVRRHKYLLDEDGRRPPGTTSSPTRPRCRLGPRPTPGIARRSRRLRAALPDGA